MITFPAAAPGCIGAKPKVKVTDFPGINTIGKAGLIY